MEASSRGRAGRGLWNSPRTAAYSKETQDMLRLMMQESRLNNFQRKQINDCLKNGASLPLTPDPTSVPPSLPTSSRSVCRRLPGKPQRRSADACRSGDSYTRDKFCPAPTRDLDKEKRRLQNLMATGEEEPTAASSHRVTVSPQETKEEERDQFQEVLDEIEDRRQFLADMASLGQERQYIHIINSEISQKIRELEVMERARVAGQGERGQRSTGHMHPEERTTED